MAGKVVLIGAGPGSLDLLTLKGKEYISKADCIIYDRLSSEDLLLFAKPNCRFIYAGKANHHHTMSQDMINETLLEEARRSSLVVRLKGGDPYVFGRGGEEVLFLRQHNVKVEVISGVTSAIAVLAAAGIPVTHRGLASGFQVITAHSKKDAPADIDYSQLLDPDVTLIFLMGLAHVREIAEGLMAAGRDSNTPAAVISHGTTPLQKKCIGNLYSIGDMVEKAGLTSPAIIVVGQVASLAKDLCALEEKPLFGKKCLVPYIQGFDFDFFKKEKVCTDSPLASYLREEGAYVSLTQIGCIEPVTASADILTADYDWIIFTSPNALSTYMWNLYAAGYDIRSMKASSIAVVGDKTAQALGKYGLKADLIPDAQNAKALGQKLLKVVDGGTRVLFPSASETEGSLINLLTDKCQLIQVTCYENKLFIDQSSVNGDYDYIFFTSASSVNRLKERLSSFAEKTCISIGPTTTAALQKAGARLILQAKKPTYEDMIRLLY